MSAVADREDQALGAAWRRCEAAGGQKWFLESVVASGGRWRAIAYTAASERYLDGFGDTPTLALTALAEALEARKP